MKFEIIEKLYSYVTFEIECDDRQILESALNEIGEDVSADELYYRLMEIFGIDKVRTDGLNDPGSICTTNEYEFNGWVEK